MATGTLTTPRFLVAKYIPDLARMEPKNIGVVLWRPGTVLARFLQSREAAKFVSDIDVYDRWISHWSQAIATGEVRVKRRDNVTKDSDDFLCALQGTQKGNYVLAEGGEMMQKLARTKIPAALDFLFHQLVGDATAPGIVESEHRSHAMASICNRLFSEAGLSDRRDFVRTPQIECQVGAAVREFKPHYGILPNKQPHAIWHRVDITHIKDVDSTAFMFDNLVRKGVVAGKDRCGTMVHGDIEEQVKGALATLAEVSTIINVDSPTEAHLLTESVAMGV